MTADKLRELLDLVKDLRTACAFRADDALMIRANAAIDELCHAWSRAVVWESESA